ncbi:MAG: RNA-binding S4 domain-containing protein [Rhodocyclaceae bacterium]|jgi:ribosome-associated protein|nr:RNA-binding S4 domain-containing protein [Rhodocyclaceae bacterium]MCL4756714.1 RNA-binding S4 domain-containing protein [Rhodocyclaceae bacterium]
MKTTFEIRGEYICLDQLLKAAGLAGTGGEAHAAVDGGRVRVDGKVESRRRAKLRVGQRVSFEGCSILLVAPAADT